MLFLVSCQKEMDKYYETPGWLKGNAWETLESEGKFSIFLAGVEKAGYKDLVNGKGIVTVIAPSDSAFQAYLTAKGYNSINEVPEEELTKIISFHLVYYSYDKAKFANFQPSAAGSEIDPLEKGLYYKHRTKSRSEIEYVPDVTNNNVLMRVFHKERFLPVFSYEIFNSKGINAKANYEFFYPNSSWTGGNDGFNISEASVQKYALVTDNGYVYEINKVLEPLETVYKELELDNNYTKFREAYNRFSEFYYDAATTANYGNGDSLFLHYHTALPKIASEWTYNGETVSIPDYANMSVLSKTAYNVFAPDDIALNNFFTSFWGGYYNTLNDVNFWPIAYLLYNHVYEGPIVFPEEIEANKIKSSFGTTITFNRAAALKKKICSNGALYGINQVLVPPMFYSVTGPALQDPKYTMFTVMLGRTGLIYPLMSDQMSFKLFLPSDSVLLNENTLVRGLPLNYENLLPKKFGSQNVQIQDATSGLFVTMNLYIMDEVVESHVAVGDPIAVQGNVSIYKTMRNFTYLMVRNDSVFSSGTYNRQLPGIAYSEIPGNRSNGKTYDIAKSGAALSTDNTLFKSIMAPTSLLHPADFNGFKTKLISRTNFVANNFNFLLGERFIVFVPTNANGAAFDTIPAAKVNDYAKYYFVDASGFTDYPFPGAGAVGQRNMFTYKQSADGGMERLTLINTGTELQVQDKMGRIAKVIGIYPRMYGDGAAYLIDNTLVFE
jgi:uncharacterized surface protein with fasciclin (FAS1) repeats